MRVSASSSVLVESFFSVFRTMSASSRCGMTNVFTVANPAFRRPSIRSIVMTSFASSSTSPVRSSTTSSAAIFPTASGSRLLRAPPISSSSVS